MGLQIEHDRLAGVSACPGRRAVRAPAIRVVWPDREHAVIGVSGAGTDRRWLGELRERVQALMVGGVRYLLVDLSEAECCAGAVSGVLAEAAAGMQQRDGWLRVHRSCIGEPPPYPGVADATLSDLFVIYSALGGGGER